VSRFQLHLKDIRPVPVYLGAGINEMLQFRDVDRDNEDSHLGSTLLGSLSKTWAARRGNLFLKMAAATIIVGFATGLAGMCLTLLLHFIQHIAFGYSTDVLVGPKSFLQGVEGATAVRRFLVVAGCGLVAGVGWAALYRWCRPLVSIAQMIKSSDQAMPIVETVIHALLQIATVALGSPLGREVAPREIGALFANQLSRRIGLSAQESRILVACGAGAGLAAVYNVPIAATIFVLEVLLRSARPAAIAIAFSTCLVAALTARLGLGDATQYAELSCPVEPSLVVWAVVFGPLMGAAGHSFKKAMLRAQSGTPRGLRMTLASIAAFLFVGLLGIFFPELLGNGKGPAQLTFSEGLDPRLAIVLLTLKVTILAAVLKSGARGGLLTPGLAVGALLATVLGSAWNLFLPHVSLGAAAIVGASAFLGSSMSMPVTAAVIVIELTHLPTGFVLPLALAALGATITRKSFERHTLALATRSQVAGV